MLNTTKNHTTAIKYDSSLTSIINISAFSTLHSSSNLDQALLRYPASLHHLHKHQSHEGNRKNEHILIQLDNDDVDQSHVVAVMMR